MDEIIWRGMTRAQLDAAYNNTAAVRNSAGKLADWIERSKTVRAERSELLDLEYGRRPRIGLIFFVAERRTLRSSSISMAVIGSAMPRNFLPVWRKGHWREDSTRLWSAIRLRPKRP